MQLPRHRFVEHFSVPFQVHCMRRWPKRGKAPVHLTSCLFEWLRVAGGEFALKPEEFADIARPVIEEMHKMTPMGERPTASVLANALYNALDAAGVEITIKPPAGAHSTKA